MTKFRALALAGALIAAVLVVPSSPAGSQGFGFEVEQTECFIQQPLAGLEQDQTTLAGVATTITFGSVAFVNLECAFAVPRDEVGALGGIALGFDCLVPYPFIEDAEWNTNLSSFQVTPQLVGPYVGSLRCFAIVQADSVPTSLPAVDAAGVDPT